MHLLQRASQGLSNNSKHFQTMCIWLCIILYNYWYRQYMCSKFQMPRSHDLSRRSHLDNAAIFEKEEAIKVLQARLLRLCHHDARPRIEGRIFGQKWASWLLTWCSTNVQNQHRGYSRVSRVSQLAVKSPTPHHRTQDQPGMKSVLLVTLSKGYF